MAKLEQAVKAAMSALTTTTNSVRGVPLCIEFSLMYPSAKRPVAEGKQSPHVCLQEKRLANNYVHEEKEASTPLT